ncbi:hypothetical protein [Sphingomonas hengshuiensis]|uniref:Homogentisate 1,2-dioxygenase n=1 Tax=Sphingomonas hengshuiensis TaxID=1609977 RepID=A0A7U4JBV6_9SPHN|nr:hypothetical protein [Sphingomonas hengshuiensis]AJP73975.1 hypothetical protein TS85_22475 [Sphingomonas hengshuiensis]
MLLLALLLGQAVPAPAPQPAPTPAPCTAMAGLPAALAAWTLPGQGSPGDLTRPVVLRSLTPEGQAKLDARPPVKTVADALALLNATPEPAQSGGVARIGFRIDRAGTYGIALDQPGWIEVAPKDGSALTSVAHGHGPECSTIRKIVRFDLQPGLYVLRLSKLTKPQAKVMLVAGE